MAFFVPFNDDPTAAAVEEQPAAAFQHQHDPSTATADADANDDDHAARLAWLKQQLLLGGSSSSSGVPSEGELAALDALPPAVMAAMAAVAGKVRSQQEQTAELLLEVRCSRAEAERLLQERGGIQQRVAAAEAERAAAETMIASLRAEHAGHERRWAEEKGELQLRLTRLAWKDATIKAQLKKKDVEYERLQKQLKLPPPASSLATVGGRERKGGVRSIDITATKLLPASVASLSGASAGAGGGDEAARLALAGADRRQAALLEENTELRETLRCLYAEVKSLEERFGELVEEAGAMRRRARAESEAALAAAVRAAEGATAAAAGASSSTEEEEAAALAALKAQDGEGKKAFDPSAFAMPGDWLLRVVGDGLRGEVAELTRRFEGLSALLQREAEKTEEEEDGGGKEDEMVQRRQLEAEVGRLRARLSSTEAVVRQQDAVIRMALFEEQAAGSVSVEETPVQQRRGAVAGGSGTRRLSDSWAAEERAGRTRGLAVLEEEQGLLFAAAERAKEDVEAVLRAGWEGEKAMGRVGTPTSSLKEEEGRTAAAGAAASTPTRTPLRTLASGNVTPSAAALLSPLLKARLDLAAIKAVGGSGSKQQATPPPPPPPPVSVKDESPASAAARAAIKGLTAAIGTEGDDDDSPSSVGMGSLSEALEFLSPIKPRGEGE